MVAASGSETKQPALKQPTTLEGQEIPADMEVLGFFLSGPQSTYIL
jgi:hypothetical protein